LLFIPLQHVFGSSWEAEKLCTRLHTLINDKNDTSVGRIDVYFKDNREINIVELKCMAPKCSIDNFDSTTIEGKDQVCSYKLQKLPENEINLFLIIFKLNGSCDQFEIRSFDNLESYNSNNKLKGLNYDIHGFTQMLEETFLDSAVETEETLKERMELSFIDWWN
jgi:hypothetical protein